MTRGWRTYESSAKTPERSEPIGEICRTNWANYHLQILVTLRHMQKSKREVSEEISAHGTHSGHKRLCRCVKALRVERLREQKACSVHAPRPQRSPDWRTAINSAFNWLWRVGTEHYSPFITDTSFDHSLQSINHKQKKKNGPRADPHIRDGLHT